MVWNLKKSLLIGFWIAVVLFSAPAVAEERIDVTFINPASTESFWKMTSAAMKAAAQDLNIDLEEIALPERNHLKMIQLAEEVVHRRNRPDYLIVVNEKAAAGRMIKAADKAGVKVMLIVNDLLEEQLKELKGPRQIASSWIGTLIPDNVAAGYTQGKWLIQEALKGGVLADDGQLHMTGIAGAYATPASLDRVKGMEKVIEESSNVILKQIVNADWSRQRAHDVMNGLMRRYPELEAVWSANDNMALGAMKAAEEAGKRPGKDFFFSGVNWEPEALKAVQEGKMVATVGGHFLIGGWGIVLIHDYHQGKDFAGEGLVFRQPMFAIHSGNVDAYLKKFGDQNWGRSDFRKFSKVFNPELKQYDFSLEALLSERIGGTGGR